MFNDLLDIFHLAYYNTVRIGYWSFMESNGYDIDDMLCLAASSGDAEAEYSLIQKYSNLVKACARPYFLAGGDSEDLIQEGMMGLLAAIREYNPEGGASFRTYSELCIRRRLYSAIRSANGRRNVSLDDCLSLDSQLFDENQAHAAYALHDAFRRGPEDLLIDKEGTDEFYKRFIKYLSRFEANILSLYLSGLSYREMARKAGKQEKSVDNAVQRIRRKLVQYIQSGDISITDRI